MMEVKFPFYSDEASQLIKEMMLWMRSAKLSMKLPAVLMKTEYVTGLDKFGQVSVCIASAAALRLAFSEKFFGALKRGGEPVDISLEDIFKKFIAWHSQPWMGLRFSNEEDAKKLSEWSRTRVKPLPKLSDEFTGQQLDPLLVEYFKSAVSVLRKRMIDRLIEEHPPVNVFAGMLAEADEKAVKDTGRPLYEFARYDRTIWQLVTGPQPWQLVF